MKITYFSVIILAWQVEKYIFECLVSVQKQTFSDFEAIIVTPHGKDKTAEICKAFVETDDRFRIIEAENRGHLINRITGFSEAKGDTFSWRYQTFNRLILVSCLCMVT